MSATISNTELEVYDGSVQPNYWVTDLFGNNTMQYRGMVDGEVINHPIITPGNASNKDDDTDQTTLQTSAMDAAEIPLQLPIRASNTIKYRSVVERPGLQLISNFGSANGQSVGQGKTIRLSNLLILAAIAAGNVVDVDEDATDGTAPEKVKQGVLTIATEMGNDMVSASGLYGLMNPSSFYKLGDNNSVISLDYGGQADRQTQSSQTTRRYLNWDIKMAPGIYGVDWTNTAHSALAIPSVMKADSRRILGVFWQRDSWVLREQTNLENTVDDIPHLRVWMCLSNLELGAKVVLPAGVWIMRQAA